MIAGGAANRHWALKSPVPLRPRESEKGSTVLNGWNHFRLGGVTPYLIDSPDLIGLSPRAGAVSFRSWPGQVGGFYFGGCSSP